MIGLLQQAAAEHPLVCTDPASVAYVAKLVADALHFELRVWTDNIEEWMRVRSDLTVYAQRRAGNQRKLRFAGEPRCQPSCRHPAFSRPGR